MRISDWSSDVCSSDLQAIAYAIDKTAFTRFVAGEDGVVTNQMVKPGNIYFDQATHDADIHAKPDLDKARALLREAGVDPAATKIGRAACRERVCQSG